MNKKKILVIIDPQVDFITGTLGSSEAEKAMDKTVELLENEADEYDAIIMTQDGHHWTTYFQTREGRNLPIFHCPYGNEGWFIDERIFDIVAKHKNLVMLDKENFGYDNWKEVIMDVADLSDTDKGEELVIKIIGLVTNMCVIVNALGIQTFFPEAEITVDASCCAGTTPEFHRAALMTMKSCQMNIINEDI